MTSLGVNAAHISFTHVTMESEKFVCVRETTGANNVVIVDMSNPSTPMRRQIAADSALMNPVSKVRACQPNHIASLHASVVRQGFQQGRIFDFEKEEYSADQWLGTAVTC